MALVELAELLNDEQRRGAAPLPDPMPSTSPAAAYGGLVAALTPSARLAAAAAAAAGNVTPAVLADALARLGSDYVQLATVESSGLLRITRAAVLWRHPLARAAAMQAVGAAERRRVQTAVADAVQDAGGDLAAVVWHRVAGAAGPDAGLAAALEVVASTAAGRGPIRLPPTPGRPAPGWGQTPRRGSQWRRSRHGPQTTWSPLRG